MPLDRSGECQSTALLLARSSTSLPSRAERCNERRSTPFSAAAARQYSMSPWAHTQTPARQPHPGPDPGGRSPATPALPPPASRALQAGDWKRRPEPRILPPPGPWMRPLARPASSTRLRAALLRTRPRSRGRAFAPVAGLTAGRGGRGLAVGGAGLEGHVVPARSGY